MNRGHRPPNKAPCAALYGSAGVFQHAAQFSEYERVLWGDIIFRHKVYAKEL